MADAVLERGFLGDRKAFRFKKVLFPTSWEEFFKTIRDLKGKLLLFYISFESGYQLLNLQTGKKNTFPPFAVAVIEETTPKGGGKFTLSYKGSSLTKDQYLERFEKIKRYIERVSLKVVVEPNGEIYLVDVAPFDVAFDFFKLL